MKDEELLKKCPLLQGLDAMHRAELLGFLNDSSLRAKVEACVEQHPQAPAGCTDAPGNFDKEVHSWNPQNPVWRRSAKE